MDSRKGSPGVKKKKHLETVWGYQYPTINGAVTNTAVTSFLNALTNPTMASAEKTLRDFNRDYALNGTRFNLTPIEDPMELRDKINEFVKLAGGYNAEDRAKLIEYITCHGGQENNFLINNLIRANHFTNDPYQAVSSTNQQMIDANWCVNKQGKIEFSYRTDILSIEVTSPGSEDVVTIIAKDQHSLESWHLQSHDDPEVFARKRKDGLIPLLRIDMKVQLDMRDGVVTPVVSNIAVTGYHDQVRIHEENFADRRDRRSLHFINLLRKIDANINFFNHDKHAQLQLARIRKLIVASNYGENMELVKLAIQYLSRIQFINKGILFIKDKFIPMAQLLNDDDAISKKYHLYFGIDILSTLTKQDKSQELAKYDIHDAGCITDQEYDKDEVCSSFGSIFIDMQTIVNLYQPVHSCEMVDEVLSEKFYEQVDESAQTTEASYNDFRSGFYIGDRRISSASSNRDISGDIHQLVIQVSRETDVTRALEEWISKNGGSQCERLADMLMTNDNFQIDFPDNMTHDQTKPLFKAHYEKPVHSWQLSADGKVELTSVYYVTSLHFGQSNISAIKNNQNNQLIFVKSKNELADRNRAPLMRIETKISLSTQDGKVVPSVTAAKVDSYSRNITPIRHELEQDQIIQLR